MAAAPQQQLSMPRGDTLVLDMQVTNARTRVPVDISAATVWMTAKYDINDADADALFQISTDTGDIALTTPTNGEFQITIPHTATSGLTAETVVTYDVQIKLAGSSRVHTLRQGPLTIFLDVTQTIV